VAVTGPASLPPSPVIEGATFYTDGTSTRTTATSTRVTVFTASAIPGWGYQLVLSRDGCRSVALLLNSTVRYANSSGVIGPTSGVVPFGTQPGTHQICFRAASGGSVTITGPATLVVA